MPIHNPHKKIFRIISRQNFVSLKRIIKNHQNCIVTVENNPFDIIRLVALLIKESDTRSLLDVP